MSTVISLFTDSKQAGEVVGQLKGQGYTDNISVIAKDVNKTGLTSEDVKNDVTDGTLKGATTGAALGALGAILVGAASFVFPGVGLVVLGPLATFLTGTAAGAAAGGLVGALTDWGLSKNQASEFESRVNSGEVLVAVSADKDNEAKIQSILETKGGETYIASH